MNYCITRQQSQYLRIMCALVLLLTALFFQRRIPISKTLVLVMESFFGVLLFTYFVQCIHADFFKEYSLKEKLFIVAHLLTGLFMIYVGYILYSDTIRSPQLHSFLCGLRGIILLGIIYFLGDSIEL